MHTPTFKDEAGRLMRFDLVTANPMWNQNFPAEVYENDTYDRFTFGVLPASSADWGWMQHMLASLNERGRMAVILRSLMGGATRAAIANGMSAARLRNTISSKSWRCCPKTCSTTPPRRVSFGGQSLEAPPQRDFARQCVQTLRQGTPQKPPDGRTRGADRPPLSRMAG